MPLPPYGSTKEVPGTPAWRALHPVGEWFKNAKYNAAYDPMHFGDSNAGIPYHSPGESYWGSQTTPNSSTDTGEMRSSAMLEPGAAPGTPDTMRNGVWNIPTWQPPAQVPQQNQGTLFSQGGNNGGGVSVPTWQPPTQGQNPALGTIQNRNQQTRQYQSPSSRYARNQMPF